MRNFLERGKRNGTVYACQQVARQAAARLARLGAWRLTSKEGGAPIALSRGELRGGTLPQLS
jgi:hypothetical protein